MTGGLTAVVAVALAVGMHEFPYEITQGLLLIYTWTLAVLAGRFAIHSQLKNRTTRIQLYTAGLVGLLVCLVFLALDSEHVYGISWLVSKIGVILAEAAAFAFIQSIRARILARAGLKLSAIEMPVEIRIKAFFAAKAKATWMSFGLAFLLQLVITLFLTFVLGQYRLALVADNPAIWVLLTVIVSFAVIWIPALVANRALAKGKSWDAFFWLSIFVSPLLMWIIAEASTDTRGMVYAPAQAPAPAYAQAAPAAYAPAAVPATPVAASDTRECPECAETIKKAAKLCKHCGSKVTPIA